MYKKKIATEVKPLETAVAKNCTVLTSVESKVIINTHIIDIVFMIITFTDGLQVEYIMPSEGEYYLEVREENTQCKCIILYPECKPVKLTFTLID